MRIPSNITWFDENDYIGLELLFPAGSTWKLERKFKESEDLYSQQEYDDYELILQSRAAFICSKIAGNGPSTAVIKVHMQAPWWGTAGNTPSIRAEQAISETPFRDKSKIEALSILTEAGCTSTLFLIDSIQQEQTNDKGFIYFIVMEMLPGVSMSLIFHLIDQEERNVLREAFKKSWQ
ncbi:hypothetical protein BO94DRAFT_529058 [Aspergillus sclerotioniger CBS 115572]|uniref:Protein kinase domain-containing protein n=1 Tax=Aspergillus sclerotioniger CBS 115572 TaxID=1450535 RepID=A0A317UYR7_9EURO|nr:hypothetical protein BO94DRAFT_529058 [Aspergillus sclerotioniger CBS 115572]PWY65667.1 hypothetical protein BO94DRAFT_529058 [Aspergillus sclerotioniger CBS 115572]